MKQSQLRDYIYFPLKKTSLMASVSPLAGSSVSQADGWPLNAVPDEKMRVGKKS